MNTNTIIEWSRRDKYGRTVYTFNKEGAHSFASVVVLPKVWVEHNPGKGRYLVSDVREYGKRRAPGEHYRGTHVRTLAEARRLVHAMP